MVLVGGAPAPLRPDVPVALGDQLRANISIAPRAGHSERVADVRVFRTTDKRPVEDATVAATLMMRGMPQMSYHETVIPAGGGNYHIPMQFSMAGAWQLQLSIASGASTGQVALDLEIAENG
jgi:hypothetical protein